MLRRTGLAVLVVGTLAIASKGHAAFPGDNGLILYSSDGDIQTVTGAGATPTPITSDPADDAQASWSPDGRSVVFRSGGAGEREVFAMNADGSGRRRLTDTPAPGTYSSQPTWSPDGRRILFRSDRDGDPDVWSMATDGSDVRQVTNLPGDERYPAFSPDGVRIVLRSDRDGDPEIYTVAPNGSDLRRLTDNAGFDSAPAWSPDGSRISFERAPGNGSTAPAQAGPADIFTMRANGTDVRQLTADPAHDEGAGWSPDGRFLVFTSERGGSSDIWRMAADGSGTTPVTTAPGVEESPDWQPRPRGDGPPPPTGNPGSPVAQACRTAVSSSLQAATPALRGLLVSVLCERPAALLKRLGRGVR